MAETLQQQWQGVINTPTKAEAVQSLAEILAEHGSDFAKCLDHKAAQRCIEILDYGITEGKISGTERDMFFTTWRRLAEHHELIPDHTRITEGIDTSASRTTIVGGFGNIRVGSYRERPVTVKILRGPAHVNLTGSRRGMTDAAQRARKRWYKEVIVWSTLSHSNVLKLIGAREVMGDLLFVTVSEWMEHGTIMEYVEKHRANRLDLLHGAAQGLEYLHNAKLVHGDIKGSNILISNDAPLRACLADFGFITTIPDSGQKTSCSVQWRGGTKAFTAPELTGGKPSQAPTPQADIYAFGKVIFQVLVGKTPPSDVIDSPDKPESANGFSDLLWSFTRRCWDYKAKSRPGVREVVAHLREAATSSPVFMPAGWIQTEDSTPTPTPTSEERPLTEGFETLFYR